MTDQQKIAAILQAIQTDANLFTVLRIGIANNIGNVSTAQLDYICQALGIATS